MSMQALVKKKFILYYNPDFAGGERVQLVEGMDFFTEDGGFREPEIGYISKMEKGTTLGVGPLRIWRVK